jgi:hypothetical protein
VEPQAASERLVHPLPEPRWLWRGRRGSADKRIISILALAETLAAATVSAYIALRHGAFFLGVSASLAPLLLLRTPASRELGLRWGPRVIARTFQTIEALIQKLPDTHSRSLLRRVLAGLLLVVAFVVLMTGGFAVIALTAPGVRFTATLVTFCRTPLQCLRAIPGNWWRIVACVDMTHVPEPLPGIDAIIDSQEPREEFILLLHPWAAIRQLMVRERARGELPSRFLRGVITALFVLIVALPAWLYRWCVKAVCLALAVLVGLRLMSPSGNSSAQVASLSHSPLAGSWT